MTKHYLNSREARDSGGRASARACLLPPASCRLSSRRRARPGQSIVLALAVMFLMIFMGALFVTMIARNLTRVERSSDVSEAQQLAEAGLRYADNQLTFSDEGADWRPQLHPTLNFPRGAGPNGASNPGPDPRDPDFHWISDSGSFRNPFVRFASGEGRFLLRVTYEPTYRVSAPNVTVPDEFDALSGFIHIEVIGRPGRFDPLDPTQLINTANNPNWEPGQVLGAFRRIDAWKPIGLTDQLWWVTNLRRSRGPAQFGVPPYEDGTGRAVRYVTEYRGGVRSNVDIAYVGDTRFHIRPGFGEGVYVAGEFRHQPFGPVTAANPGNNVPGVQVQLLDNMGMPLPAATTLRPLPNGLAPEGESGSALYDPLVLVDNQRRPITGRGHYLDNLALADASTADPTQSIRVLEAPRLDAEDPFGGTQRYRRLTRDSGELRRVMHPQSGEVRDVNLGVYGYGAGLYIDNFDDIQYPNDRDVVVNEWLQRGVGEVALTGWAGFFYTPSVRQQGGARPILEAVFTENDAGVPVIRLTRSDPDREDRNFGANRGGTRLFYAFNPAANTLAELGTTAEFRYPENGIMFCEGSVRVRGRVGSPAQPRTLSLVSGGTIYIEGNLLKGHSMSRLALLARDHVVLNTTKLTNVIPGDDVQIEGDQGGVEASSFHYSIPQNGYIDIQAANVAPIPDNGGLMLLLQHSAGYEDSNSRTDISLYINGLEPANRYDFAAFPPPFPPAGTGSQMVTPYQFFFFPPSVAAPWHQSNALSIQGSSVNYERKAFFIPAARLNREANAVNSFRIHVEPTPGGQPYWLSRAMVVPFRQPLDARIEAVIYAQNGSWFVIPGPWFNDNPQDRRDLFVNGDPVSGRPPGSRGPNTFPANSEDYPFYREPPNVRVLIRGTITENMPVPATERVQWIKKLWAARTPATPATPAWYDPNITYEYDDDLRKWVRYRNVVTGQEGIAYVAPDAPPANAMRLRDVRQQALMRGENIVTLPLFPRLPTGGLIYHGTPQ